MSKMIPPIPKGTLVGIANTVGAFEIIRRGAPNFYYVKLGGKEVLIRRAVLTFPLPAGRYLLNGQSETFVEIK